MDKQTANKKLKELRDSLSEVLDRKSYESSEDIKKQSAEAIKSARKASSALKKSFIERVKDFPVVQKVSELGTAGSVAVSTAAVAQTGVALDQTEVFVASVANDIVEERIEPPMFISAVVETFVTFEDIDHWGQGVIQEKLEVAQTFVEKAETIVESSVEEIDEPVDEPVPVVSEDQSDESETDTEEDTELETDAEPEESDEEESSKEPEPEKQTELEKEEEEELEESLEEELEEETKEVKEELPRVETPINEDDTTIISPVM